VEGGSSTRDDSSLILPPVKNASSSSHLQPRQSSLLSPMAYENMNHDGGGSLASGSMDTLVSFPILSSFQQLQQQQQQPLFGGASSQDGGVYAQQRPSTSSAVIDGAEKSTGQRASTSPGRWQLCFARLFGLSSLNF